MRNQYSNNFQELDLSEVHNLIVSGLYIAKMRISFKTSQLLFFLDKVVLASTQTIWILSTIITALSCREYKLIKFCQLSKSIRKIVLTVFRGNVKSCST